MCDTIVAPPGTTSAGTMLFGKNSDRERNEAQAVQHHPGVRHTAGAQLKCTYISIPQAPRTNAVLLCRPFWTWGAEMGTNEHGVVIGNEGLHARSAAPQEPALIGMDLVRLGLERAGTAREAVDVVTSLLERYGQGGNCGHQRTLYYNNGFLIADSHEAFVLETVDREWMLERASDVRSMSNRYSIGANVECVSKRLHELIRDSGWNAQMAPDYAAVIADPDREHIGNAAARRARSSALLGTHRGRMSAAIMMKILRDHGDEHAQWRQACLMERTLCMHAGAEDSPGQTVGSMVSELLAERAVHWVTATAAPCVSIFKPLLLDVPMPFSECELTDRFDAQMLWWRHERLHRAALTEGFAAFLQSVHAERDELEREFQARIDAVLSGGDLAERTHAVSSCWRDARETEDRWYARLCGRGTQLDTAAAIEWMRQSRLAGIDFN